MRALPVLLAAALLGGCGTTSPQPGRTEVTDADRAGAQTALELLRNRHPGLQIDESGGGLAIRLRGRAPVVVVDGMRTPYVGRVGNIPASEVAEIEVLTSMSDTLVYGADAAEVGVVRITTRLHRE
jgi:hypothetical protein